MNAKFFLLASLACAFSAGVVGFAHAQDAAYVFRVPVDGVNAPQVVSACHGGTVNFSAQPTGQTITVPVPAHCHSVAFVLKGAGGGEGAFTWSGGVVGSSGAPGALVSGRLHVTPGTSLTVYRGLGGWGNYASEYVHTTLHGYSGYSGPASGGYPSYLLNAAGTVIAVAGGGGGGGAAAPGMSLVPGKASTFSRSVPTRYWYRGSGATNGISGHGSKSYYSATVTTPRFVAAGGAQGAPDSGLGLQAANGSVTLTWSEH